MVTPQALCPHVSDLVWEKYVTTELLWQKVKAGGGVLKGAQFWGG